MIKDLLGVVLCRGSGIKHLCATSNNCNQSGDNAFSILHGLSLCKDNVFSLVKHIIGAKSLNNCEI